VRIRTTVPPDLVNERTLGAGAEANTEVSQALIERGGIPPLADAIEQGMVRWKPEDSPPGDESFDHPGLVLARGWGDCDDLAPWWAAELRASEEDPEAKAIVYQSGAQRWHVVVQRGDGSIDDPSRWAGMGRREGTAPAVATPMATSQGEDAVVGFARDSRGNWRARIDVPTSGDGLCGVAIERVGLNPWDALMRAVGDISLAVMAHWGAPDDVIAKMVACNDILHHGVQGDPDDYAAMGPFVHGLARAVCGAIHATVDPGQAANLAATIVDPLGLRNLIPGLANTFVSNYASSLAQRGATPQPAASGEDFADGDDDVCPPGYHWENHGGISICVKDKPVMGCWSSVGRGSTKKTTGRGRGSSSTSSRGRGTGRGRGSSSQQQQPQSPQPQQPYCDPSTGLCYDQSSGYWYDQSGNWYDQYGNPLGGYGYSQPYQQPAYGGYYGGYAQQPGYGGYGGYYGGGGTGPLYPY